MNKLLLTKVLKIILISALIASVFLINSTTFANNEEVKVSVKSLNVRSGPGLSYGVTGSLKQNDLLSIIETSEDWLKVSNGKVTGWIASWFTEIPQDESSTKEKNSEEIQPTVISQVSRLNIRSQPSLSSAVILQMSTGDKALAGREKEDWIEVKFNGTSGWVSKKYVSLTKTDENSTNNSTSIPNYFEVSVDALNVRSKPDLSSKKMQLIHKGESYLVLEQQHNWLKIQLKEKEGWVNAFHGNLVEKPNESASESNDEQSIDPSSSITILHNGTNLRENATTDSQVVYRAYAGEKFPVKSVSGDWYEISLLDGTNAFVAGWLVNIENNYSSNSTKIDERKLGTFNGLNIVLDPGHGGNDHGTVGTKGTDEKNITLLTAEMLADKLTAAGATVTMTRNSDMYVDLRKRVSIGHQIAADAFISLHYDATESSSIHGFTTYYQHSYQKSLAEYVHAGLGKTISLRDRGAQPGNYLVLRENNQNAILIELGFLSNPNEERIVTTEQFREQATLGIYNGLLNYFDDQLK